MRSARSFAAFTLVALSAAATGAGDARPPKQDEDAILNDVRAVISAEAAYSAANFGFYGPLPCLEKPATCIQGYPQEAPPFLSRTLAALTPENGYVRAFHAGPKAPAGTPGLSAASITSWAYTAQPGKGSVSRKAFCGDSSGRICVRVGADAFKITNGECPSPCERVQ